MRWTDQTILAFDNETTGFYPENGDRVMEFGAAELRVNERFEVVSCVRHEWLIDPQMTIPSAVVNITHIKQEDVDGKPTFDKLATKIHALLASAGVLVAHNFPFDQRFLAVEFAKCGLAWPMGAIEVDTLDIARLHPFKSADLKLGTLVEHFGVKLVEAHRAAHDAEACGRVFLGMAQRFQAPLEREGLLTWAGGLDPMPPNAHIGKDAKGNLVFLDGESSGQPIEAHPDLLQWMTFARVRDADGTWGLRYPEELRAWILRFLRARCSGRFPAGLRGFGPGDWGIDLPVGVEGPVSGV